ncbi:MAG: hypothetical protein ISS53_00945 [Dehalococcoidia bacterium]|nr:hypothetical protein [Dehalococcoidia bacterium]
MEWQSILVLVLVIPVILFPAAFVWYLNVGGIYAMVKKRWREKAATKKMIRPAKLWYEVPDWRRERCRLGPPSPRRPDLPRMT